MKKSATQLVLDADYLNAALKLIESATSSIDLMAFSFAIGSAGGKINFKTSPFEIAQKLIDVKKKKKLRIRVYLEGDRETAERNFVTANFLKEHGIQIKMGATHAKGFCVDEKAVLFGSTNLTHQSIVKNSETNVLFSEPTLVQGFMEYFEHLWSGGVHGDISLASPLFADQDFEPALLDLIQSAKKSLEFSIYFFDHSKITNAFIAAHKRGVHITGYFHDHNAFALSYVHRTHRTANKLIDAGIEDIYFAPPNLFTHSKYLIKDGKELFLGTGNWLHEDVEIHPQLYILLQDTKLCRQLSKHLKELTAASLPKPPEKARGFTKKRSSAQSFRRA